MNISFFDASDAVVTYGMNRSVNSSGIQALTSGTGFDGVFGVENYGEADHFIEFVVTESVFNDLLSRALLRTLPNSDYDLLNDSCVSYAQEIFNAMGNVGSVVDQFRSIVPPSDMGLLFAWDRADLVGIGVLFSAAAMTSALTVSGGAMIIPLIALNVYLYHNRDPLILDLDGDGIELTALGAAGEPGASSIYFDYARDGYAERTGWAAPDDGMLAIDANGNGIVDDISELFGSPTQDGFAVLETLDSNQDGVIDQNDVRFGELRVWRDLNQNGLTDAGELQTMAEAGLASISISRTDVTGTIAGHDRGGRRRRAGRGQRQAIAYGKRSLRKRKQPYVNSYNCPNAVVTTAFRPLNPPSRVKMARSTTSSDLNRPCEGPTAAMGLQV